ncbi:hypothetical protein TsFJ059_009265 [Trichoderma semiorbis]|uniref:Uncharacterized protein n=1 Tax=Trichoderma semiorbis TaxID=1491008 RepID=A0A9P8HL57_9HYPO|nr:hypothetical protein TsFJ059_009265 [Trichoderma semiorbis]
MTDKIRGRRAWNQESRQLGDWQPGGANMPSIACALPGRLLLCLETLTTPKCHCKRFHVELQKKLRKRLCTWGFILHVAHDGMQDPDRGERETLFICTLILEMLHWELELVWANCCACALFSLAHMQAVGS